MRTHLTAPSPLGFATAVAQAVSGPEQYRHVVSPATGNANYFNCSPAGVTAGAEGLSIIVCGGSPTNTEPRGTGRSSGPVRGGATTKRGSYPGPPRVVTTVSTVSPSESSAVTATRPSGPRRSTWVPPQWTLAAPWGSSQTHVRGEVR